MFEIPSAIEKIIEKLIQNGYESYIVGGCVRDMLLGKKPDDYDVTTSATPEEIMKIFEKTVPTGIKHGTVTVIIDKTPVEVTTFRTESEYNDHRRPDSVTFVRNLKDDLFRRDFTVNAFAYNHQFGIADYFGGKEDLKNKILRAVGEPQKRFSEDALRILRLFRFSSVLNFKIEEDTLNAAINYSNTLEKISGERIFTELYKAVKGENLIAFKSLINAGGLSFLSIIENPDYETIKKIRDNNNLAFFMFLYLSKADFITALSRLKVSNFLKNYCLSLKEILKFPLPCSKEEIKKLLCDFSPEIFCDYLLFKNVTGENTDYAKNLFNEIINNNEPYLLSHLAINGNDLKEYGITGRKSGEILKILKEYVIKNPDNNTKIHLTEKLIKIISN